MKILHLTDLHFTDAIGNRTKQLKLIQNLVEDLQKNVSTVDFVLFTGDIVNKGSSKDDFDKVQKVFLKNILETLNVPKSNFFICPGNHDVDRGLVSKSVIKYLDESIKTNEDLNDFFRSPNPDLDTSHKPLQNYRNFVEEFFDHENDKTDLNHPMYTVHIRDLGEEKVGWPNSFRNQLGMAYNR